MSITQTVEGSAARPNPQRIGQYVMDHLGAVILATAVQYSIFAKIEGGADTCEQIASAANTSVRGTQALLDGLVAIGLLTVSGGRYANTAESSFYLIEGKPGYMGLWISRISGSDGRRASRTQIPAVVKHGGLESEQDSFESEKLALALAPEAWPVAQFAAARLKFSYLHEPRLLDVGGGAAQVLFPSRASSVRRWRRRGGLFGGLLASQSYRSRHAGRWS
jgi:hypothetical protein